MDPADFPAPQRRWWLRIVATFFALLVLYALSAGPAVGYCNYREVRAIQDNVAGPLLPKRFLAIYGPLFSMVTDSSLERPLNKYTHWWTRIIFRLSGKPLEYPFFNADQLGERGLLI